MPPNWAVFDNSSKLFIFFPRAQIRPEDKYHKRGAGTMASQVVNPVTPGRLGITLNTILPCNFSVSFGCHNMQNVAIPRLFQKTSIRKD